MKIVLVCIQTFQPYILENIQQLQLFGNTDITVLTEPSFFNYFPSNVECIPLSKSSLIKDYISKTKLSKTFRDGFWIHCFTRFLYIYEYLRIYNVENIIHLENDVMSYVNFDELVFGKEMMITMDSENRCIPGIIYCKSYKIWQDLFNHIHYGINDMEWMAYMYKIYNTRIGLLPIIHKDNVDNIFDAAAIGQYLGGVDPRNACETTPGFINETCDVKYNVYRFHWLYQNNLWVPYLFDKENRIRINTLHIHSKQLNKFSSISPMENKYISKFSPIENNIYI
jgi:hypothetical protein